MFTPFVSIGIDISKASLDVYGLPTHQPASFSNHAEAIATLLTALTESAPDCIVCEPSGGYERSLVAALQAAGLPVALVNAREVRPRALWLKPTAWMRDCSLNMEHCLSQA